MAKQKVHEQFGVTFPESYWRPAQVTIVPADRRVGVVFYGYASSAARHAGLPPIGQRSYFVHEDDYEAPPHWTSRGRTQSGAPTSWPWRWTTSSRGPWTSDAHHPGELAA
jgi:hypothetical protein